MGRADPPARGLSEAEAQRRLEASGPNALPRAEPTPGWRRLVDAIRSPLVLLLLGALGFDLGAWALEGAEGVPIESLAIVAIVALNAGLEVIQGARAERALQALESLATPTVEVWRDGHLVQRTSDRLVVGDVVRLTAGTRVPADGRLTSAAGMRLDTSALTGESVPEDRVAGDAIEAGTMVVAGRGEVVLEATGSDSAMGRLATLLGGIDRSPTPLQRRLARFGRRVAFAALILAGVLFGVGLSLGGALTDTLLLAVALTVAAVPEGLPAVVTGALALGTQRMARRNAVVRRLAAVETLGSVSVMCADKTGTLTENRLHLIGLDVPTPDGPAQAEDASDAALRALRAAVIASDAEPDGDVGDPIERAIHRAAERYGLDPQAVRDSHPRSSSRPFDARWAFLRSTVALDGRTVSFLKGAPDRLLDRCRLSDAEIAGWTERIEARATRGERTLLVAHGPGETEHGLEPLALLAFRDPPRAGAARAIAAARGAGARVVMITGDHPATARAIAAEVGIATETVATGDDIDRLAAEGRLVDVDVFARTAPERKLLIVEALQHAGETVAMTGDGVNDGPALRRADVGVAMGLRGSDVAREAADLVLLDDDVATLVAAIEEGRGVAANLRSFVRFLFAANLAEVVTVSAAFGWALASNGSGPIRSPLTAAQILWINLVTDALPALALALDRRPEVMHDAPATADAPLLSGSTIRFVAITGAVLAGLSLAPLGWGPAIGLSDGASAAATFTVLVLGQLALIDGARRERHAPAANRALRIALLISVAVQGLALGLPPLRTALSVSPLPLAAWPAIGLSVGLAWAAGRFVPAWEKRRS